MDKKFTYLDEVSLKIKIMPDDVEEELKIIEERDNSEEPNLEFALSIHEPIEKILYPEPVIVLPDTTVIDAINLFNQEDVGCVLVVNPENQKLIGIFTERDVVRKLINKGHDLHKETIDKYMTTNPDSLELSDPIAYALNRMAAGGYRHIPLVDESRRPVGFISIKDIVEHLADYYSNEILNLPPSPHEKQRSREGG